jgi:hypothetical protein
MRMERLELESRENSWATGQLVPRKEVISAGRVLAW